MKTTLCTLALKMLDPPFVETSVEEVLDVLGEGVQRASDQLERAVKSGNEEFAEVVTDEVCDVIEHLLGAAFVVCQASITRVVSRVAIVHKQVELKGQKLTKVPKDKPSLMAMGKNVGKTGVSQVAAIDAFANYFKHESEWSSMWTKLKGNQAKTAGTVMKLGASAGSTGNLRRGARVLGNKEFNDMRAFADIVERWRAEVQRACAAELKALGLIA